MKRIILGVMAMVILFGVSEALAQGNSQAKFNRSMMRGISGDDVRQLQAFLAQDSTVYPEGLTTGYFGPLTEQAVLRFQKKHDIDQVGIVGPKTRTRLHALLGTSTSTATSTVRTLPPGQQKKLVSDIYAPSSSSTVASSAIAPVTICHIPKGNPAARHTITVGGPAVRAHAAHGDTMGPCDGTTTPTPTPVPTATPTVSPTVTPTPSATPTPTPDTTSPSIYSLAVSALSSTTATISWLTNESATSAIWYATSTPITISSTTAYMADSTMKTSHSLELLGLTASTQYYYLVVSADAAGNAATSTTAVFTTTL